MEIKFFKWAWALLEFNIFIFLNILYIDYNSILHKKTVHKSSRFK